MVGFAIGRGITFGLYLCVTTIHTGHGKFFNSSGCCVLARHCLRRHVQYARFLAIRVTECCFGVQGTRKLTKDSATMSDANTSPTCMTLSSLRRRFLHRRRFCAMKRTPLVSGIRQAAPHEKRLHPCKGWLAQIPYSYHVFLQLHQQ